MNLSSGVGQGSALVGDILDPNEINAGNASGSSEGSPYQLNQFQRTIIDSLLLMSVLGLVAIATIRPSRSMDEDLWWHLRTGNWILNHHAVPTHDTFSSYTMGKPIVAYSWLFEVLISKIYQCWTLHGILAFTDVLLLACLAGVIGLLSRYINLPRAIALGTIVLLTILPLASPRPWLFTILFFVIELCLLLNARERGTTAWLWPVIPLFAVWANIHIQFVYGLGLIGLFALERPIGFVLKWPTRAAKVQPGWYWVLLVAATLSTLVNPYGWRLYDVVHEYAIETVPLQLISEMQPLRFRSVTDWSALVLVCSAYFAQAGSRRKSPLMLALLVVSCWFGFRAARDVWFLAIASALAIASSTCDPEKKEMRPSRWKEWTFALAASLSVGFAMLCSSTVSDGRLLAALEKRFPERAAAYIQNNHLRGPLYNTYGWGGYLIWRLPFMPVSIDGRANVQGDAHLARSAKTCSGKEDWAEDPDLKKANIILLERNSALASILSSDIRYRRVYQDDVACVFQPARTEVRR